MASAYARAHVSRLMSGRYLGCKIDGEDGGGLGGPVGVMMVVVMMSPLLLLPSEQILVAERNAAIILTRERLTRRGRGRWGGVWKRKEEITHLTEAIMDS